MPMTQATHRLEARITAAQKTVLRQAADARGVTLTAFVVSSAYEAAVRALQAARVIELGRRDQAAFVAALTKPARPNRRLRDAAARHGFARPARRR